MPGRLAVQNLGRRLLSGCDALASPTMVLSNHWSPPILITVYMHIMPASFWTTIWFYFTCKHKSYTHLKLTTLLLSQSTFSHENQLNSFYTLAGAMIIRIRVQTNHMLQNISTTCPKHNTGLSPPKLEVQNLGFLAVCTKAPAKESEK